MSDDGDGENGDVPAETLESRIDSAEEALDEAETEADLDEVEATLDEIEADLEAADLPEPEDEDEADPREELESALSDLRDELESKRGPYAEDAVDEIETAKSTITDSEWTDAGERQMIEAVRTFLDALEIGAFDLAGEDEDDLLAALDEVVDAIESADLDADEDEEEIAALLETTDGLSSDLDDAEVWSDLTVREKLDYQGFYDVLEHRKDYPPEWHALKIYEQRGDTEMILLAYDKFDSDFMERHCLEALERMGSQAEPAVETLLGNAEKRDKEAITILGKIGTEEAVETLLGYVDTDSDPELQKVTFKALGEIGSEDAVQPIANKLVVENPEIRSRAARALGLIGDTRAIDPLADVLESDDHDPVRASAAWALNQIGTRRALDVAADYADDRSYIVQEQAERAANV